MTDPVGNARRNSMLWSVRRGLQELGDLGALDAGAQLTLYLRATPPGRSGAVHTCRDIPWLQWLRDCFPELGEPECEPYVVPDDLEGPETVPWLTARTMEGMDVHRWWQHVFTHEHAECSAAALTLFRLERGLPPEPERLMDWARQSTKREQARLWNKVMKRLGYTEDVYV